MFKDKIYEEMDDVSRMFEPFQFDLNDELARFPDKIEILPKDLFNNRYWGGYGVDLSDLVELKAKELNMSNIPKYMHILLKKKFFKFEFEELEEGEMPTLNAESMTMSHKLFLVKSKIAFDEQELETMRKNTTINTLKRNLSRNRDVNKPRLNEIADIYGANDVKSDRSYSGKVSKLCDHLEKMMEEKVLDIRDIDLCNKFVQWIVLYVKDGNLAALNNLTRIKIITHEKRPIYSIEEKEV